MALTLILCLYVPIGAVLLFYALRLFCLRYGKARQTSARVQPIATVPYDQIKPPKDETCAICLQPFRPRDAIAGLKCPHLFHWACLQPWLVVQNQCPLCRVPIESMYDSPVDRV